MLQSWLEIEPAQGRGLTVREPLDHAANVLRNRVWYRGDACELDQLFKQLGDDPVSRARFWAAAPESENLRKAHSGLPAVMVDTLAGIVRGDMEALRFDDPAAARRWQAVADENDFPALVARAVSECLVTGDGAFRVCLDTVAATGPILDFAGADRVEYVRRHGRVVEVVFLTCVGTRGRVLRERLVEDKGTLYPILEVVGGAMPPATPAQCYGGFALSGDPLWGAYLEERITKLRRAAEGLRRSSSEEEQLRGAELEKLAEELCVRKGEWEHANCGGD